MGHGHRNTQKENACCAWDAESAKKNDATDINNNISTSYFCIVLGNIFKTKKIRYQKSRYVRYQPSTYCVCKQVTSNNKDLIENSRDHGIMIKRVNA